MGLDSIGRLLGPQGSTLGGLREKYQVNINLNQETRAKGYSVVTIRGSLTPETLFISVFLYPWKNFFF